MAGAGDAPCDSYQASGRRPYSERHVIDPKGLTPATTEKALKLYRLLCVPEDFAKAIVRDMPVYTESVYTDEWSEEALSEDPGVSLFALSETGWAAYFDDDFDFDDITYAYGQMLKTQGMTYTLARVEALPDSPEADELAELNPDDLLAYLIDLQCDAGKVALLLCDESEARYAVVVRAEDLARVRTGMSELFGPSWTILHERDGRVAKARAGAPDLRREASVVGAESGSRALRARAAKGEGGRSGGKKKAIRFGRRAFLAGTGLAILRALERCARQRQDELDDERKESERQAAENQRLYENVGRVPDALTLNSGLSATSPQGE